MDYSNKGTKRQKQKLQPHGARVKNKIGLLFSRALIAIVLVGGFAAAGIGAGLYMGIIANTPELHYDMMMPKNYTTFIYDNAGREMDRLHGEENRIYVSFDQIPQDLINAFVAIEDERFYSHNGIDFRGMARAVRELIRSSGSRTQGASTITQQLIKNKLDRFDSDLTTKLQEQWLAVQLEKKLAEPGMYGSKQAAKNYIMEIYLNEINLGRGTRGVQAAAMHYYGKDVSELTLPECATIAAITQNPTKFPPDTRPDDNWPRASTVLDQMLKLEFITEEEHKRVRNKSVYDGIVQGANLNTDGVGVVRSYFTDQVFTEVSRDLMAKFNLTSREASNWIYSHGLRIYTTQDTAMQEIVDKHMLNDENFSAKDYEIDVVYRISTKNRITNRISNYEKKKTVKTKEDADAFVEQVKNELLTSNDLLLDDLRILTPQPQASFVVIDPYTGQVKAVSGGRGEKTLNRSFNRATAAMRSPGSQFKVLASYAPALDLGRITPSTVINDEHWSYRDGFSSKPYTPTNWYRGYEGPSTVRRGIYHSMNILAVRNMIENISIEIAFGYMQNFGFSTLVENEVRNGIGYSDKVASLPLGGLTDGIYQVELCAAYATIANLGEYNKPIFYTKVLDHEGNIVLENRHEPRRVLRDTTAYLLTDMMRDTLTIGTGTRCAFPNMPIAGKTGTSTDTKDLSFTGYTPYYVASVWMGFDQQKKINESNHHKDLWKKIMEEIHLNLPEKQFDKPAGISNTPVCRDSGLLATSYCRRDSRGDRTKTDIFAPGAEPVSYCGVHQEQRICTLSGMHTVSACPEWEMRVVVSTGRRSDDQTQDADFVMSGECIYHGGVQNPATDTIPGGFGTPSMSDVYGDTLPDDFTVPAATAQPTYRPEIDEPIPLDFWDRQDEW